MAKKDPAAVAREFAVRKLEAFVGPEMEWSTDQGFENVVQAVIEWEPANERKDVLTLSQVVALEKRIDAALPDALQKDFYTLSLWQGTELLAYMQAGFLGGLEMGRRVGCAR